MSSDGSVSSRISQFGLYRTIDARTEEFLKLSKKRQIKQGCVCAAISTALTVTVVVTVFLIYEYNVIAEARKSSHPSSWLGLMNKSADDSNLLEVLNREKIDIDKTTLKLLPILLKALNQNSYSEKTKEDPANLLTPNEKEITTETPITKNIFADTRNWMKTPRLYTVEYKTSPIVYFKNPTRNIEYFTKIRKIRDYQRILNYVDKMISEKNYLGTTQPMRSQYGYTERPYKATTPAQKHVTQKLTKKQQTSLKAKTEEKQSHCKCSHKLSDVMYKLLNNIQQLLSYFSRPNVKEKIVCDNNSPTQTIPLKSIDKRPAVQNIYKVITENYNVLEPQLTGTLPYKTFLNRHKYTIDTPTRNFDIRRDHTVNAIMNLIKPSYNKLSEVEINFEPNESFSTTTSYIKSDVSDILKGSNTKSHPKHVENNKIKASTDAVTTVADYILQKGTYDASPDMTSPFSTFPESDFSDDDDYGETTETTTILAHNFKRLNPYTLPLIQNNFISGRKNMSNKDKSYPFKGARISSKLLTNIGSMRKMGNLVSKDKLITHFIPNHHRFAPVLNKSSKPTTTQTTMRTSYKKNDTYTVKPIQTFTTIESNPKIKTTTLQYNNPEQNHTDKITLKEKAQQASDENISKETALKHIEEAIMILKNETTTNQVENYNKILTDNYEWELVKLEENATTTKSMMPLGRSTYLEMQRNDWKHEDNQDFDNDINDIFD